MDIEFDDDESGFWEARAVYAMASGFHPGHQRDGDRALVDFLKEASLAHMNREAYAELRAAAGVRDGVWPSWSLLNHLWRPLARPPAGGGTAGVACPCGGARLGLDRQWRS